MIQKNDLFKIFSPLFVLLIAMVSQAQGYRQRWDWQQRPNCHNCRLVLETNNSNVDSLKVRMFLAAIGSSKSTILSLYSTSTDYNEQKLKSDEYNLLALMAFGIIGNESKFFGSMKYTIKESIPLIVSAAKEINGLLRPDYKASPNSRGPSQIKVIPRKIAERFQMTPADLKDPEKAALATMGFLIESLQQLKRMAINHKLDYINQQTYVDYLPYIYFGKAKALVDHTATPDRNIYIQQLKKYMEWVDVYEVQ